MSVKPVFGVRFGTRRRAFVCFMAVALSAMLMLVVCGSGDGDSGKSGNNPGGSSGGNNVCPIGEQFNPAIDYDSFTDSRDGKIYRTVVIGTQTWMAENLNFNASGSVCYDNQPNNCARYGRLYNWATAMDLPSSCNSERCSSQVQTKHQGICPDGWHVPNHDEWVTLTAGKSGTGLKTIGCWNTGGGHITGTDEFGFSALPGGSGNGVDGSFNTIGTRSWWWSTTEESNTSVRFWHIFHNVCSVSWHQDGFKASHYSLRCIQN